MGPNDTNVIWATGDFFSEIFFVQTNSFFIVDLSYNEWMGPNNDANVVWAPWILFFIYYITFDAASLLLTSGMVTYYCELLGRQASFCHPTNSSHTPIVSQLWSFQKWRSQYTSITFLPHGRNCAATAIGIASKSCFQFGPWVHCKVNCYLNILPYLM